MISFATCSFLVMIMSFSLLFTILNKFSIGLSSGELLGVSKSLIF